MDLTHLPDFIVRYTVLKCHSSKAGFMALRSIPDF